MKPHLFQSLAFSNQPITNHQCSCASPTISTIHLNFFCEKHVSLNKITIQVISENMFFSRYIHPTTPTTSTTPNHSTPPWNRYFPQHPTNLPLANVRPARLGEGSRGFSHGPGTVDRPFFPLLDQTESIKTHRGKKKQKLRFRFFSREKIQTIRLFLNMFQ